MHIKSKKVIYAIAAITFVATISFGTVTTPAIADPRASDQVSLSSDFVAQATQVWTENAVPAEVQTALLAKLKAGKKLDSMTETKPVSTDSKVNAHDVTTVERYADGSINIFTRQTSAEVATGTTGGVSPQAIDYCINPQPGVYNDCLISGWFTLVRLSFRAYYYTTYVPYSPQILSYNAPFVQCYAPASCSAPTFNMVRQVATPSNAAELDLWTVASGIFGSTTTYLRLYVAASGAWTN